MTGVGGHREGGRPLPTGVVLSRLFPYRMRRVTTLLGLVLLSGCAASTRPDPMGGRGGGEGSVAVYVSNLAFNDATLTAITTGNRIRLGIVSGKGNQVFTVPWTGLQELRVQISVLAGGNYTTPSVTLNPGERVELVIQENVRASQIRR